MLNTAFVSCNNRMALYRCKTTDIDSWETNWKEIPDKILQHSLRKTKKLGVHRNFFRHWLPRDGIILEAGCGTGLWVNRLTNNNWKCIGIDYAGKSLFRSKKVCPHLILSVADIRNLPFADESIVAYLSFGVIEHFKDGPKQILAECSRILKKKGIALISVPFDNFLRKNINKISEQKAKSMGLEFYQYYFRPADMAEQMKSVGLTPIHGFHAYGVQDELARTHILLKKILNFVGVFGYLLDFVPGLPRVAAHMVFIGAQKK